MAILCLNAGSSSLKFALFAADENGKPTHAVRTGMASGLENGAHAVLHWGAEGVHAPAGCEAPHEWALRTLLARLQQDTDSPAVRAIAHRVVHGGSEYHGSAVVDGMLLERLQALCPLAPLHQPHNLAGIRATLQVFAGTPQVACFDTAFHHTIPALHHTWALPETLRAQGLRRYGFHGLSYQGVMQCLRQYSPRWHNRVLMAHLGNGASLCAALQGRSLATTMGTTALDGLIMGTRCGALDPGVLLHLLDQGHTARDLQHLLYEQSGLLGLSSLSADMRALRASSDPACTQAIALFTAQLLRQAGAMVACLQGLDVLTFSGGIGENDGALRQEVCAQLAWLGVRLDEHANAQAKPHQVQALHLADSAVEIWLIPSDENRVMASEACHLLQQAPAG